jgi:hypothetical protein
MGLVATQNPFDWKLISLIGVVLSVMFTLIFTGIHSLRRMPQIRNIESVE